MVKYRDSIKAAAQELRIWDSTDLALLVFVVQRALDPGYAVHKKKRSPEEAQAFAESIVSQVVQVARDDRWKFDALCQLARAAIYYRHMSPYRKDVLDRYIGIGEYEEEMTELEIGKVYGKYGIRVYEFLVMHHRQIQKRHFSVLGQFVRQCWQDRYGHAEPSAAKVTQEVEEAPVEEALPVAEGAQQVYRGRLALVDPLMGGQAGPSVCVVSVG